MSKGKSEACLGVGVKEARVFCLGVRVRCRGKTYRRGHGAKCRETEEKR